MRKRNLKKIIIFVLILCISIGFAVLTATLSMNASFSFAQNSFNLYFSNINVLNTSTVTSPTATITDDTTISYSGTFNKPGDYIEFSFYIINNGTIDGQINTISTGLTTEQAQYIDYDFKYAIDNSDVNINDIIYAGQARKVIAHFEYKEDIDDFIDLSSLNVNLTMHFIQPQTVTTTVWNYEYLGDEQYFIVPKTGNYKLEVWGASGGTVDETYHGGYGGYSTGVINLLKGDKYYINVGGEGEYRKLTESNKRAYGGYNGGGTGSSGYAERQVCGGGGATHIASANGVLSSLESNKSSIIIVAGGGAGSWYWLDSNRAVISGSGGGYIGTNGKNNLNAIAYGGTQNITEVSSSTNNPGAFGLGSPVVVVGHAGAGGGYYGGNSVPYAAGGGSGYIGNTSLTDKIMYCYQCQTSAGESNETHIKTRPTTNVSSDAISAYAKVGNGYARITYIG